MADLNLKNQIHNEKKMRNSRQREQIYEYLYNSKNHPSAEQVYESLKVNNSSLSLGTVYRNLKLLEELGKIKKIVSYNGVERYDAICSDHLHFICEKCGSIYDLENSQKIIENIELDPKFKVTSISITLKGLCSKCN